MEIKYDKFFKKFCIKSIENLYGICKHQFFTKIPKVIKFLELNLFLFLSLMIEKNYLNSDYDDEIACDEYKPTDDNK